MKPFTTRDLRYSLDHEDEQENRATTSRLLGRYLISEKHLMIVERIDERDLCAN